MTEKVEKIIHNGEVFAIILRKETKIDGLEFLTPEHYPLQVGVHLRKQGEKIRAHVHNSFPRQIKTTQEVLHIDYGKLKVDIIDENLNSVSTTILNSGDTILFVKGGHGFEILEEAKIIEVKQGPYESKEKDKIYGTE